MNPFKTMIIAQISDTHILPPDDADPVSLARSGNLRRCVEDINGLDPAPDAVIHTGDMTQSGQPDEFAHAREILSQLAPPLYVTPGNRDSREGVAGAFAAEGYLPEAPAFLHYAVDGFPVRLISVDSLSSTGKKGDFCEARLAALDATLGEMPDRPTALFMHHPPFGITGVSDSFQYERREAVAGLAAVLADHAQVIRIFCGHAHRPRAAVIGAATATTTPSVAIDLRKGSYPSSMAARAVYQVHRFYGNGGEGSFASHTRWEGE